MVMKKASAKGQIMMILGLLALFIFLFILVFFTQSLRWDQSLCCLYMKRDLFFFFLLRFKINNRHAFNYSVKCKSFCAMYVSGRLQKVLIVMKMGSNVFQIYSRILILDTLDYVNDASDIRCLNHFLLHVLSIYCLSLHIHLMGDTRQSCSGIN